MRTRILGLAVCVATAMVGTISPANAGELTDVDPARDVRYYDWSESVDGAPPATVTPDHRNGDLRRYSVRYGEHRIRVVLTFRELKRTAPVLMIQSRFRWPGGGQLNYAEAVITATKSNRAGTARLTSSRCKVEHRISYLHNRVHLSFPSRCLSSPRWIQFNAWVLTTDRVRNPSYLYGDHVFPVISNDPNSVERFTRRIRRP